MSKCTKCGAQFVGLPEHPVPDGLCRVCENDKLRAENKALQELANINTEWSFGKLQGELSLKSQLLNQACEELVMLRAALNKAGEILTQDSDWMDGQSHADAPYHFIYEALNKPTNL